MDSSPLYRSPRIKTSLKKLLSTQRFLDVQDPIKIAGQLESLERTSEKIDFLDYVAIMREEKKGELEVELIKKNEPLLRQFISNLRAKIQKNKLDEAQSGLDNSLGALFNFVSKRRKSHVKGKLDSRGSYLRAVIDVNRRKMLNNKFEAFLSKVNKECSPTPKNCGENESPIIPRHNLNPELTPKFKRSVSIPSSDKVVYKRQKSMQKGNPIINVTQTESNITPDSDVMLAPTYRSRLKEKNQKVFERVNERKNSVLMLLKFWQQDRFESQHSKSNRMNSPTLIRRKFLLNQKRIEEKKSQELKKHTDKYTDTVAKYKPSSSIELLHTRLGTIITHKPKTLKDKIVKGVQSNNGNKSEDSKGISRFFTKRRVSKKPKSK